MQKDLYFVTRLKNETSATVALYEYATGEIVKIEPSSTADAFSIAGIKRSDYRTDRPCRIIDKKEFARLKQTGASLVDCAVPYDGKGIGRHGVPITRLFWAENPRVQVRLSETVY